MTMATNALISDLVVLVFFIEALEEIGFRECDSSEGFTVPILEKVGNVIFAHFQSFALSI